MIASDIIREWGASTPHPLTMMIVGGSTMARSTVSQYQLHLGTESKVCKSCSTEKPVEAFHKLTSSPDGLAYYCKPCKNEKLRKHRKKKPSKQYADRAGRTKQERMHKLEAGAYKEMLLKQGGKCAICGSRDAKTKHIGDKFFIDHNHNTGKVRGLLCRPCNSGLGMFKDNEAVIEQAVKYLRDSRNG